MVMVMPTKMGTIRSSGPGTCMAITPPITPTIPPAVSLTPARRVAFRSFDNW